eukprot:CAMPEP_0174982526 /NCGR_PEP_ID=MMETSP0004_2-20121128/16560_1 /TAXON_ID=420556 /ORGANISM="Ochromonas sp., Strain CCMP1393" /LENGTH=216 /DNA_ID=CAMNT_0016234523 /DNA_START=229 /DNA_END=879 /DNA_ORIENTATION=+
MKLDNPRAILDFWFGSDRSVYNDTEHFHKLMGMWFMNTVPEVETIFKANSDQIDRLGQATNTDLGEEWLTPEGYLAHIVMLDQGTRTAFRGTSGAFAYDDVAKNLSIDIIRDKKWFLEKYLPIERQLITMPLMHSEDIEAHEIGHSIMHTTFNGAPEAIVQKMGGNEFFIEHTNVIRQFNRYPSRNGALGRENTPEETAWLASPDIPGWAKSQTKA